MFNYWLKNKKLVAFFLFLAVCSAGLFLPTSSAKAGPPFYSQEILGIFFVINTTLAKGLEVAAQFLSSIIAFQVSTNTGVVQLSWGIVRDFSNMLFILIMIIMAFATIFDLGSFGFPGYDVNSLIARFLIAALLINFSLVICGLLIDGANVVNSVLLKPLGNANTLLLGAIKPTEVLGLADLSLTDKALTALGISDKALELLPRLIFGSFILIIIILSLVVAGVVAVVRIPILWLLMIFSPLAYISDVLPMTKGITKNWWDHFIRWNTFLPVFLLVLYFGFSFLRFQSDVINGLQSRAVLAIDASNPLVAGLNFSVQTVFFYLMIAITLIGGVGLAISGGIFAGAGGIGIAQKTAAGLKGWAMRTSGASALGGAISQKAQQVQKEGLPGRVGRFLYGGQAPELQKAGRFGAMLGVREAEQQAQQARIKLEEGKIQNVFDQGTLENLSKTGPKDQQIAARKKLASMGMLDAEGLSQAYMLMGGNRSGMARDFLLKADLNKLSPKERMALYDGGDPKATDGTQNIAKIEDLEIRKKLALARAEKGEFGNEKELMGLANLFSLEGDRVDLLEKAKKKKFTTALRAQVELNLARDKDGKLLGTYEEALTNQIPRMKVEDLADLPVEIFTLGKIAELPTQGEQDKMLEARKKLVESMTDKKITNIMERAPGDRLNDWDEIFDEMRYRKNQRRKSKQTRQGPNPNPSNNNP